MFLVDQLCRTSVYDVTLVYIELYFRASWCLPTRVPQEIVEQMHIKC
jgi:hypothetical protein